MHELYNPNWKDKQESFLNLIAVLIVAIFCALLLASIAYNLLKAGVLLITICIISLILIIGWAFVRVLSL